MMVLKKAFGRPQTACAERRINQSDAYSTRERGICRSFSTPSVNSQAARSFGDPQGAKNAVSCQKCVRLGN